MTSTTNLRLLLASGLFGAATLGGLMLAAPAHADYGATPIYNDASQVCSGRYDPNCIVKETDYMNRYSNYGYGSSYNYNDYNRNNYSNYNYYEQSSYAPYYTPSIASYNYNYAPSYSYNTPYQYQYSYDYNYQYQYQNPTYQYSYSYPTYNHSYNYGY
jgi:hypothetical protein